jgi:hypothetical protein
LSSRRTPIVVEFFVACICLIAVGIACAARAQKKAVGDAEKSTPEEMRKMPDGQEIIKERDPFEWGFASYIFYYAKGVKPLWEKGFRVDLPGMK